MVNSECELQVAQTIAYISRILVTSFRRNVGFTYRLRRRMAGEKRTSGLQAKAVESFLPLFQRLPNTSHVYCALVRDSHSGATAAFA